MIKKRYIFFRWMVIPLVFLFYSLLPYKATSAGEFFIKPGENKVAISVDNADYSVGPVTIKVTVTKKADWFSINPMECTLADVQPGETRKFSFTLDAQCDLSILKKISGEATFLYKSSTTGVIDSVRERTHTFVVDKTVGFVANKKEAGTVTVVNLDPCGYAGEGLAQLSVGKNPYGIAVRTDGKRIYATNMGEGTLSVIELNFDPDDPDASFENAQESKVPLGQGFTPNFIAITPDNCRAYIADQLSGVIKVVNLIWWTDFEGSTERLGTVYAPYTYIKDIPVVGVAGVRGDRIEAMAIDPAGRRLWVVVRNKENVAAEGGCVAVINIEQVVLPQPSWPGFHSIIDVIDLKNPDGDDLNEPSGIAFTPDGDLAYITGEGTTRLIEKIQNWDDATGGIVVIDPQSVYDPSFVQGGTKIIDYIAPHVLGSKDEPTFIKMSQVDYTPFMPLGGGSASGIFLGMQEMYNYLTSLLFDQEIYKFPVDIDGAKSIAISPDGKRAYITFLNTNNFGIIDLMPSRNASGFNGENLPGDNDIYAASEAILIDPAPSAPNNPAAFRFPNEVAFSRDGHYIMISNMSNSEDLVDLVDNKDMDVILNNVGREDLTEDPINEFPVGDITIDGDLIRHVDSYSGIDDPEGIAMMPGYDNDGDMNAGGSSNLVEAKNRFNSLLNLPAGLSAGSLISSNDNNLLSPVIQNSQDPSKNLGRPYGDFLDNYEIQNHTDTMPGQLINGVLLPTEGVGYRHDFGADPYNSDNAGILTLINLLEDIGREWFLRHPEGPRIVYLDLSRPGGGQFMDIGGQSPEQFHAAHQNGLDVNVRYMRKDKSENLFDFVSSNGKGKERDNSIEEIAGYDPKLSTDLINMFLGDERVSTVAIDPRAVERAQWAGLSIAASDKLIVRGTIQDPASRRDYDDHFGVRVMYKNFPPVVDAGKDKTVNEGDPFSLIGSGSFDPDGDSITYKWSQKEGPSAGLTVAQSVLKNPGLICPENTDPAQEHTYMIFGLVVFDGEFESDAEDTVSITINRKPIADAGADQTVDAGEAILLDGSQSSDPDGDNISYTWKQIAGLPVGDFYEEQPSLGAPYAETVLVFELKVNDSYVDSEADTVTITVNPPLTVIPPQEEGIEEDI